MMEYFPRTAWQHRKLIALLLPLPSFLLLLFVLLMHDGEAHTTRALAASIRQQTEVAGAAISAAGIKNSGSAAAAAAATTTTAAAAVVSDSIFGADQARYQREQRQRLRQQQEGSAGNEGGSGEDAQRAATRRQRALHGLWHRAPPPTKRDASTAAKTESHLPPGLEGLGFFANTRLIKYEPSLVDGKPYPVRSAKTNATTVFCLLPKNASTRLKAFLAAISGMPVREVFERTSRVDSIHQAVYPFFRTSMADYAKGVHDPTHPRVAIVRNPYIRIRSTYLDKYVGDGYELGFGGLPPKLPSFAAFVDALYETWLAYAHRMPPASDEHVLPQTDQCLFLLGYRYDYILKLELMDCWLPDLVAHLGATDIAKTGWDAPSSFNTGPAAARPCFFAPHGINCDRYWSAVPTREDRARCTCAVATAGAESSTGGGGGGETGSGGGSSSGHVAVRDQDTVHVTNAATVVFKHYTRRAAYRVTEMYGVDIGVLGYRRWDGVGPLQLC